MKKVIITYGVIAGLIVSIMLVVTQPLLRNGTINYDNGMWLGYTTMVIALSMVFVGVKSYRDQHLKGSISFGKAFQVGILISLLAGVMYCVSWEIYYNTAGGDFMQQYTQHYIDKMKRDGANEAEMSATLKEMESFNELYKNPLIRFGATLLEILPVGLLITLLSAALLRKKELLPASQTALQKNI